MKRRMFLFLLLLAGVVEVIMAVQIVLVACTRFE